jgi:histidinol dehydrogenase
LGVTELYRIGGAQGVAAMAYGVDDFSTSADQTGSAKQREAGVAGSFGAQTLIKRVDKIVGPGNLFVALAKQHVFGDVDIDSIAGPSEVAVVADTTARAEFIAADMLAQAEHSPGSSVLLTWDPALPAKVLAELEKQTARLSRGDLGRAALEEYGLMIVTRDAEEACRLADRIAPEHLHLDVADPEPLLDKIPHAGAAFLGHYTPVALGDYAAGPSHVLPTGGTARFASGLSANDFLRSSSVIHVNEKGLADLADDVRRLADVEGLTAHRESVDVRMK